HCEILPDHVYVLPPGKDLAFGDHHLTLVDQDRSPGSPINLPIDRFVSHLAREVGDLGVAVILSGSGSDGSRGIRDLKEAGGVVLVQDPYSARFDGMPRSAIQTGLVDHVGEPPDLARRMQNLWEATPEIDETASRTTLDRVLALLRARQGSEHRYYRRSMIARRVRRRMALAGIGDLGVYCALLESDPRELYTLRQDLLIGVTGFFRDPWAFETLSAKVLPALLMRAQGSPPLRVWVTACSTGQEVYSIAISILEALGPIQGPIPVKIFATDVNDEALARASRGRYTLSEVADIPPPLVAKYFEQRGSDFVVHRDVREMVIFAPHNVVTDPPFTRMDLVCCRNLLIYLEPQVQNNVLLALHFALRPHTGVLFLGSAEVANPLESVVTALDDRARLFRRSGDAKLPGTARAARDPVRQADPTTPRSGDVARLRASLEGTMEADQRSSAIVTTSGKLIELLTDPNGYFRLAKGLPSTNLSALLPPGI
ncbi:MAG: hypothetical protein KC656_30375, partial [Myxococcales bacterium]|nr:hypothetical protein [Myxococcales bacterium]